MWVEDWLGEVVVEREAVVQVELAGEGECVAADLRLRVAVGC